MFATVLPLLAPGLLTAHALPTWPDQLEKLTPSTFWTRDAQVPIISNTSLHLLYQNNINHTDSANHVSGLLTSEVSSHDGEASCSSLSESPMPLSKLKSYDSDFLDQFNYLCHLGTLSCPTHIWIEDVALVVQDNMTAFNTVKTSSLPASSAFRQLCTQSDDGDLDSSSAATTSNSLIVADTKGNAYTGYRNKKAFRFLGIPYANKATRFEHSTLTDATNKNIDATAYGSNCLQSYTTTLTQSEDCLFLNIHSPFLPAPSNKAGLKPVLFYIHGGAFETGSGAASTTNADNLASREDVVGVTINYRLNAYGFLAVPDTNLTGNYGISDMVNALQWTINNIASFGGDPDQINIMGSSAGAAAVRILLGSGKAIGMYQRAIIMSNLGGGATLNTDGNIGTTNSRYLSIEDSYSLHGNKIFTAAGCNHTSTSSSIACLRSYIGNIAHLGLVGFPVQDGTYITSSRLELSGSSSSTSSPSSDLALVASVPVIMGTTANDGASFTTYSTTCTTLATCLSSNLAISLSAAESIVASGLWPYTASSDGLASDAFNISQRVRTADTFRCVDQASAIAGATSGTLGPIFYYQFERTFGGYNPAGVDAVGPASGEYPSGNPYLPYYRLHSSETAYAFGTQVWFRDDYDYYFMQLVMASWGSFIRTGDPNPDVSWQQARGYKAVSDAVAWSDQWEAVEGKDGPMMMLDAPSRTKGAFQEVEQCAWLNYTLTEYLT